MGGYVMSIKDCKAPKVLKQEDEVIDIFDEGINISDKDTTRALAGVVSEGFNKHGASNLDKTFDIVAIENKKLKLKVKELEQQLQNKNIECSRLKVSNSELEKRLEERTNAVKNLEHSRDTFQSEMEELKENNNNFFEVVQEWWDERTTLVEKCENLEQSNYNLCSDICTKNSSYSALQCRYNTLEEKIEQCNIEYEDLKKAYKEALANIENLEELNKKLSEDKNFTTRTLTHYEIEIDDFDKKYKVAEEYIKYLISCISERDANLKKWVAEFGNSPKFKVGKPKGTADKARKYREEGLSIIQVTEKLNKELNNIGYSISRSMVQRYINGEDEGVPLDLTFKFPEIKKLEDMLREKGMDIIEQSDLQQEASEMLEKIIKAPNSTL